MTWCHLVFLRRAGPTSTPGSGDAAADRAAGRSVGCTCSLSGLATGSRRDFLHLTVRPGPWAAGSHDRITVLRPRFGPGLAEITITLTPSGGWAPNSWLATTQRRVGGLETMTGWWCAHNAGRAGVPSGRCGSVRS